MLPLMPSQRLFSPRFECIENVIDDGAGEEFHFRIIMRPTVEQLRCSL